jgi:membrane associated rhomboid family serine protease
MFIPLRTDRPPRRHPLVTEGLIALNLLVYLAGLVGQFSGIYAIESFIDFGHLDPRNFHGWQLITSVFMHDPTGLGHIAFNMLFLWVFGAPVEDRLGRIGFLGFYLIGGAVAGVAHMMIDSSPVIGASGAIAAVTGAFLALFPRSHVVVLFLIGFGIWHVPSLWFIGLDFVVDLLRQAGHLFGAGGDNVAYMAHIAGYVYGFALAFVLLAAGIVKRGEFDIFFLFTQARRRAAFRAASQPNVGGLWESASADTGRKLTESKVAREAAIDERLVDARMEINRLAAAGDLAAAAIRYKQLLDESPSAVFGEQRQLELANQLYAQQDFAQAAAAYELFVSRFAKSAKAAEVRLMLGLLYTRQLKQPNRAREVIDAAKPHLHQSNQLALADELLAELQEIAPGARP